MKTQKKSSTFTTTGKARQQKHSCALKKLGSPQSAVFELPYAGCKDGVIVPFPLTACILESAVEKFAANEPFAVHINDGTVESLVLYLGHKVPR